MLLLFYDWFLGPELELWPTIPRLCCYCILPTGSKPPLSRAMPGYVLLLHLSPGLSYSAKPKRPRPWFFGRSSHLCILDTSATATASVPVPHDPDPVVVLHVPDPRTFTLLVLWVPACMTTHQEEYPRLELLPTGKIFKQEDSSILHHWESL